MTSTTTTTICPHVLFYFILLYIYLTIYPLISFFFLNVSFFIWFYGKLLLRDYTFYSLFYYCYILLEEGWHGHIVVVVVVVVVFLVQTTFFILLYFGLYTIYIHSLLDIKVLFSNLCLISLFNFFFPLALPCLAFSMAIVKTFYDCQKINKNIWLICYCCHLSLQYLKILYVSLIKIEGERKKDKNMLVGMGVYLVGDLVYTLYYILLFVVCIFCSQITQFCCSCCRHLSFTFTFMFEEEYSVSYFTAIFHNYNTPLFLKCFCFFFVLFSSNHNCSFSNLPIFQSSNLLIFYPLYPPHTPLLPLLHSS